ncbi:MAG: GIY-YIG nuclease family protein [Mariprofundaceae bacterium]|nr:GIY-YIG nuclease family protein [Mariprofundaceae bacterium]
MHKQPCTYILASAKNGTLYIGVTSNLIQRIWQHKNHQVKGFTEKYAVNALVYYEQYEAMDAAITREKQLKNWNRAWKINLIEQNNPNWRDLWQSIQ